MDYLYKVANRIFEGEESCKAMGIEGFDRRVRRLKMAEELAKRAVGENIIVLRSEKETTKEKSLEEMSLAPDRRSEWETRRSKIRRKININKAPGPDKMSGETIDDD